VGGLAHNILEDGLDVERFKASACRCEWILTVLELFGDVGEGEDDGMPPNPAS